MWPEVRICPSVQMPRPGKGRFGDGKVCPSYLSGGHLWKNAKDFFLFIWVRYEYNLVHHLSFSSGLSAVQPAVSCGKNYCLIFMTYFSQICSYLPCMQTPLTSVILQHFQWLRLCWGSQGQHKTELIVFVFLHNFQLIRMEFDVLLEQFKSNIVILLFLLTVKNFNACIHLEVLNWLSWN